MILRNKHFEIHIYNWLNSTMGSSEDSTEIIVSTFINCHLFWIIPKKNLLIRAALNRYLRMNKNDPIKIKNVEEYVIENKMVAVNIEDLWARAIIKKVVEFFCDVNNKMEKKFVCWLPDYGVMRIVRFIYPLPKEMKECPHLAKQASLHNVVNLMTDLIFGKGGYELKLKKTLDEVQGVKKVALDCIEEAESLFFLKTGEDKYNIYGDIYFLNENKVKQSLTDYLIMKKLLGVDKVLFESIDSSRELFKKSYFEHSSSWNQELDKTETKYISEILSDVKENEEKSKDESMEFFQRKPFNDRIAEIIADRY